MTVKRARADRRGADGRRARGGGPGRSLVETVADFVAQGGDRPSWEEYFMATALLVASRSACGRLHVGCVLVSGGSRPHRIIAAGYNGFLPGAPHRSRMRDGHEQATVHAEQNAIADAARRGVSVEGATAYVSHHPCVGCAKVLAAAGVRSIVYHHDYRNDPLVQDLLDEAGVSITRG